MMMMSNYNGTYPEEQVEQGIRQFITQDKKLNGPSHMTTQDIYLGLQKYCNLEIDCHSIEYIMNKICNRVGTTTIDCKTRDDGKLYPITIQHKNPGLTLQEYHQYFDKLTNDFGWGKSNYNPGTWSNYMWENGLS